MLERFASVTAKPRHLGQESAGASFEGAGATAARPLAALIAERGRNGHYAKDSLILLQEEPVETIHQVVSGVVRCYVMSEEGRRQITRFAWPGDYLGCVAIDAWHFSAEAVQNSVLRSVARETLEAAEFRDPELHRDLRRASMREMKRREAHLARVAYLSADERLLDFLGELLAHTSDREGYRRLPLMRRDIADYLGLSVETVSRAFTSLKRAGLIAMRGSDWFQITADGALGHKARFAA